MTIQGIVRHLGVFRRSISLWEGVALILSGTIGAGILAIPYAIARVGILYGLLSIVLLGALMIGLNILLGKIVVEAKQELQLAGLARRYLGSLGGWIMTAVFYAMSSSVLVVYLIGVGHSLVSLFGGHAFLWSMLFFVVATLAIAIGLRTIKMIEFLLTVGILLVVVVIALLSVPYIVIVPVSHISLSDFFFPYGIILFAFHSASAIPEAHALLNHNHKNFYRAILIAGCIALVVYGLFAAVSVGVMGRETTEIATIGLGRVIGPSMAFFGSLFAVLAMATSYLLVGLSLRDSLHWDFRVPRGVSVLCISAVPLILFLFGIRQFIAVMDFAGSVFVTIEILLILLIFWRAKKEGQSQKECP